MMILFLLVRGLLSKSRNFVRSEKLLKEKSWGTPTLLIRRPRFVKFRSNF